MVHPPARQSPATKTDPQSFATRWRLRALSQSRRRCLSALPISLVTKVGRPLWASLRSVAVVGLLLIWGGAAGTTADFSGRFTGQFEGAPTSAELQRQGDQVVGRYEVGGYVYQLRLRVSGTAAEGLLLDPSTGASLPVRVQANGKDLRLAIFTAGTALPPVLATLRAGPAHGEAPDGRGPSAAPLGPAGSVAGGTTMPGGRIDPVLVGTWSQSTSYTSGDFSAATNTTVTLAPDGRVIDGGSRVAGGGDAGSFDSGGAGGGGVTGHWSTVGQVLYMNEGAGWQPVGRYHVEGHRALLTRGDGSREVWRRH